MLAKPKEPRIPLPKGWQSCVKSAVLLAIALAHYAIVYARAWAADSINARVRLSAENDRLQEECALLREELRIKDARTAQIAPHRSRRSVARITPSTSAWRSSSFALPEAGRSNKPPTPSSSHRPRLHRG
jgi:hypothetical protein